MAVYTVEAQRLILRDGSNLVSISRSIEHPGISRLKRVNLWNCRGVSLEVRSQTVLGTNSLDGNGRAGDITIDTKRLTVSDGAVISLSTGVIIGENVFSTVGGQEEF